MSAERDDQPACGDGGLEKAAPKKAGRDQTGATAKTRPNVFQWVGYACGRTLPDSMREWVKNDLTGDWAAPRHLWRSMTPFLPIFALILVLVPGQLWLRGAMVLLILVLALVYSGAYMKQNRVSRLVKHGLPADLENPRAVRAREESRARYLKIYGGPETRD